MTKQEFLNELKEALSGEVSPEALMDSYRYYDAYIDEYVSKGQREEDVIDSLGRPSLIARSIIAAQTGERMVDEEYTEDGRTRKVKRRESADRKSTFEEEKNSNEKRFFFGPGAWYAKVLYVLILLLFLVLVFCVLRGIIWVFFTFGIPVLIILGIIYLIMYFFGDNK